METYDVIQSLRDWAKEDDLDPCHDQFARLLLNESATRIERIANVDRVGLMEALDGMVSERAIAAIKSIL